MQLIPTTQEKNNSVSNSKHYIEKENGNRIKNNKKNKFYNYSRNKIKKFAHNNISRRNEKKLLSAVSKNGL
jgi:hypothetical protein